MKTKLLLISSLLISSIGMSQTGPGGIGSTDGTSNLRFWFDANHENYSNGANVSNVSNLSGYGNDLNASGSERPTFNSSTSGINNMASFAFNGDQQFISLYNGNSNENMSFCAIYKASSTPDLDIIIQHGGRNSMGINQTNYVTDYIGGTNHTSNSTHVNSWLIQLNTISNSGSNRLKYHFNNVHTSTFDHTIEYRTTNTWIGGNGIGGGTKFNGNISEVFKYTTVLSKVERIIIDNYLSAKYAISLGSNDFYSQDNSGSGNFDHHVAGIGRANDGSSHTNSQGTGIIQMNTPSSLSTNEYLFWGEDTKNATHSFTTTSEYLERQNSSWRVSKTGDLGTVTVSVAATDLDLSGKQSCATFHLIVSNSSSFGSKTSYPFSLAGGIYTATNVSFTDGDYFTLEYQDQIVVDGNTYLNGSGLNESPNTTDACYKLFVKSNASNLLFLQQDAVVREVEIEIGGIFNLQEDISLTTNGSIVNNGTINVAEGSSIIQTHTGTNNNSGTGTYQVKRVGNNSAFVYNIWSSPIESAAITSIFPGGNPCDIFVFEESTQSWKHDFPVGYSTTCYGNAVTFTANNVISSGDGNMDIARGYFAPGNSTSTRSYSGTINNGEITIPITTTNLINPGGNDWGDDDWNLIGNPYPSAISAASFWTENAQNNNRIMDAVYFWDEADTTGGYNQHSDYASWNLSGGVNSGNSVKMPQGHIASGQGFWVVASTNTNVVFTNSMRTGTNSQFFKTTPNTQQHNAWVSFASPSNYKNNILVGYNKMTTDSFDQGYDAHKLVGNGHVRFASVNDSDEFVIQSVAPLAVNDTKVIPLVVFTDQSGTHVFSNYLRKNLNPAFEIYLRDLQLGTDHDLGLSDYEVTLTANTEYTQRFQLVFMNKLTTNSGGASSKGLGKPSAKDSTGVVNSMFESISNQEFIITQTTNEITIQNAAGFSGAIQLFDISGKLIWNMESVQTTSQSITWNSFAAGSYFISVNNGEHTLFRKHVIKP